MRRHERRPVKHILVRRVEAALPLQLEGVVNPRHLGLDRVDGPALERVLPLARRVAGLRESREHNFPAVRGGWGATNRAVLFWEGVFVRRLRGGGAGVQDALLGKGEPKSLAAASQEGGLQEEGFDGCGWWDHVAGVEVWRNEYVVLEFRSMGIFG